MSVAGSYVSALEGSLVGPRRVRRGLVREAHDHLADAVDAYSRAGLDRDEAERLAVRDFGELDEIVPAFQTTLAVAASRRTAWLLLAILSVQPFLWDGGLLPDAPDPGGVPYAVLDQAVEMVGGLAIVASVLLVLLSGIGNRWFRAGRGLAKVTSFATLGAAGSVMAIAVSMMLLSHRGDVVSWSAVLVFVVVPMSAAASAARRTLATC